MFAHEKLQVYGKALSSVAEASECAASWSKKHAVVDQLNRASESLIINLADAARFRSSESKVRALDYAIGSSLECAACLDIASIKGLVSTQAADQQKQRLCEVTRMMIGLRKVWETWKAHEEPVPYGAEVIPAACQPLFHHETLELYAAALDLMRWLVTLPKAAVLPVGVYRQLDERVTSIILNIAEGNGRYSEPDQHSFLEVAEGCAVKLAACLDLTVQRKLLSQTDCDPGKTLLERTVAMLSRM
jgi:four helix bundle protein